MADTCSRFENLDPAILICILSACHSANDLWACIRTSPVLYQCFSRYRKQILLRINFNLLGSASAIRDAVFLSYCDPIEGDNYQRDLEQAVDLFRRFELKKDDDGLPLATDMDWDTITAITRRARIVSHLAELYVRIRFDHFRTIKHLTRSSGLTTENQQAGGGELDWERSSRKKMERISHALARLQLLINMNGRFGPPHIESFIATIFPLFRPWGWEHISQLDTFIARLIGGMLDVEQDAWDHYDRYCAESRRREDYFRACYHDPETLYRLLVKLTERDAETRRRVSRGNHTRGTTMAGHGLGWLNGSDAWEIEVCEHNLPLRGLLADAMDFWSEGDRAFLKPPNTDQHSPPWAWHQATGGKNLEPWGASLDPPFGSYYIYDEQLVTHTRELTELCRCVGMVFGTKIGRR